MHPIETAPSYVISGVLAVDKPSGMTSHDVVDFIRRRFKIKKAGHAGTLDPSACGLLVVLLGKSTKLSNRFINDDKEYEAVMTLGARSDTQDSEGKLTYSATSLSTRNTEQKPRCKTIGYTEGLTSVGDFSNLESQRIKDAFGLFEKSTEQLPPMYSAVKYKGKKLYELARQGMVVERKARPIKIHSLKITYIKLPEVSFIVNCSKGTYVRQLASDIGDHLGCGAYLSYLKRTRSGVFSVDNAVTFEELKKMDMRSFARHLKLNDSNTEYKRT